MQAWRSQCLMFGPLAVSLILASLITVECLRAGFALWGARPTIAPTVNLAKWHKPVLVDVGVIKAAHLFGAATVDFGPDSMKNAPDSAAPLTLLGTLATANPRRGIAIIASDGATQVYGIGDALSGASLQSVFADRVVLNRDGNYELLRLRRFEAAPAGGRPTGPSPASVDSTQASPPENALRKIADVVRAEPVSDGSDKLLGFRIAPGGSAAALIRAGLRPGDLLTAVNGTPLADQDREGSQNVLNTMLASGRANVTVLRAGKPLEVAIEPGP